MCPIAQYIHPVPASHATDTPAHLVPLSSSLDGRSVGSVRLRGSHSHRISGRVGHRVFADLACCPLENYNCGLPGARRIWDP